MVSNTSRTRAARPVAAPGHATRDRAGSTLTSRALLVAVVAVGCASHMAPPAPAPAVDGRCGADVGICLLGVPAPLNDDGEAFGWQCLGINGGAAAACGPAAPVPAQQIRAGGERSVTAPAAAGAPVQAPRTPSATASGGLRPTREATLTPAASAQIAALLAAKAGRTPAERKVSSQLLYPEGSTPPAEDAMDQWVEVDIRADVTPAVLTRIRALSGTVVSIVPRYRSIRARLPLGAVERLADLDAVQSIRSADEAATRGQPERLRSDFRRDVPEAVTIANASDEDVATDPARGQRDDARYAERAAGDDPGIPRSVARTGARTSEGDVAHQANLARRTHDVDGIGIAIGVLSDGVDGIGLLQNSDLPDHVTVMPGQHGRGNEGRAMLEIVHDLAPGADLYFATGLGGQAQFAENIEALCEAGADVIVDDVYYFHEAVFQDGIVAQGVNAAAAAGCVVFSAAGNAGNLNDGTAGVWEGDYSAGSALIVNGETLGVYHDFGGGVERNRLTRNRYRYLLQWADPLGASANDYDLFLLDEDGDVIASSTNTQDGTQDPIEYINGLYTNAVFLAVVKVSGEDRYLHLNTLRGQLELATAGQAAGHSAAANAAGVAAVDVLTAAGDGGVFNGTESVRSYSSDGPRRIFFRPDGTPITPGDFSATGGQVLQKPDLTAADGVSTTVGGFSTFNGTSAAAPHAAAIAALMLEAAGGPANLTPAALRAAMTGSALDISVPGTDRDSGAGIVMAPGAVAAVAQPAADRNGAPTVVNTTDVRSLTLVPSAAAKEINLASVFADPDDDPLTYTVMSSAPNRLEVTLTGASLTLTPVAPTRAEVTLRAADPEGLGATHAMTVVVEAGNRDYDVDDDGLIEVATLAQLDALRHDLNGDGAVDAVTDWTPYGAAFGDSRLGMGCPGLGLSWTPWSGEEPGRDCRGYELSADLDFDSDGNGSANASDTYWNGGAGWKPIGVDSGSSQMYRAEGEPFRAILDGNGHSVANLFINRSTEDGVGLFAYVGSGGLIRNLGLVGVSVTGADRVGSLAGFAGWGSVVSHSHAKGHVSGRDVVGGLVGGGFSVRHSYAVVRVSGTGDRIGGLTGISRRVLSSYATGRVSGRDRVGGLTGFSDTEIRASYATGSVTGRGAASGTSSGSYCSVTGGAGGVGGLAGHACGTIAVSYATGAVFGDSAVGGLVGSTGWLQALWSYWDLDTSGVRVGIGSEDRDDNGWIDSDELRWAGVTGLTTAALQGPTGYEGVYRDWNLDMDGDSVPDDPWRFGTASQYPALPLDTDGNGKPTWEEFGYQLREGPSLTATTTDTTDGQAQVQLIWTAVDASHWMPAPDITYSLTRAMNGASAQTIVEESSDLQYADSDVTSGMEYTYQVEARVAGGAATRSARVSVIAGQANQPPLLVGLPMDRTLREGGPAAAVDVAGLFGDPDGDTLTYAASSSASTIATVSVSASVVTITPASAGVAVITVTATDTAGSNTAATQRIGVQVVSATAVDYDADDDGLIEIATLAQLDAVRYDLNGNGIPDYDDGIAAYSAAFPDAFERRGCPALTGCTGYELTANLDFDTNGSGGPDAGDAYWNDGLGWEPIGAKYTLVGRLAFLWSGFKTTFEGNGHTVANLFVKREYFVGLFGIVFHSPSSVIRNLGLTDVEVTGLAFAGGLAGMSYGAIAGSTVTGRVSGDNQVGGLVGDNEGFISASYAGARVRGDDLVGGLVGDNNGVITYSYASGPISGDNGLGGLAGDNDGTITASYATGRVSGDGSQGGANDYLGGLVGNNEGAITAAYATGRVVGGGNSAYVAGLVGRNLNTITASYATGRVLGRERYVAPLAGTRGLSISASYWDTRTSGHRTTSRGEGKTTAQLQAPTGYSGIYATWNLDLDGDGAADDPWDFGTASQYPVLRGVPAGNDRGTWQQFGYQLRDGPKLTAAVASDASEVTLSWTAPPANHWVPAPEVAYSLIRTGDVIGDTAETLLDLVNGGSSLNYTDTGMKAGVTYTYQVAGVVARGEAVHSATVSLMRPGNRSPVPVGMLGDRTLRAGGSAGSLSLGGAFRDPEGDALTYGATSSATAVATVSVSGAQVTITPVAAGQATITATATDEGGSNLPGTHEFVVTVVPANAADYDTDTDGLIDITTLAQLDAVRHDLDGNGIPTASGASVFAVAFPETDGQVACAGFGCTGYELRTNLDFDTNGNGSAGSGDTYWHEGRGWLPIGEQIGFGATFEGNGHAISNLFINRISTAVRAGLFDTATSSSVIRRVALLDVRVTGTYAGGLVGYNYGVITGSHVTGRVSGNRNVGGLAAYNAGTVTSTYSRARVSRKPGATGWSAIGGLIGLNLGTVTRSYAGGACQAMSMSGGWSGPITGSLRPPTPPAASRGTGVSGGWSDRCPRMAVRLQPATPPGGSREMMFAPR